MFLKYVFVFVFKNNHVSIISIFLNKKKRLKRERERGVKKTIQNSSLIYQTIFLFPELMPEQYGMHVFWLASTLEDEWD